MEQTTDSALNRRTITKRLLLGAAMAAAPAIGRAAAPAPQARNIVLVHGLFADGSSWSKVMPHLQARGLNVTSVQNPLTTLPEAVAACTRALDRQDGPTVLVGHSFSGMIVTDAGVHRHVASLVYVAARAPDAGEDYTTLAKRYPTPPASAGIVFDGDEGRLTQEAFLGDFAPDLPRSEALALCGAMAVPPRLAGRPDDQRGMAQQAVPLCHFNQRSRDRSWPPALHGDPDGGAQHRTAVEPCIAPFASSRDR